MKFSKLQIWKKIVFLATVIFTGLLFFKIVGSYSSSQHFTWLAQSFIDGHLHFNLAEVPDYKGDFIFYLGDYFWAGGPFPAIAMIPFILLGRLMNSSIGQSFMNLMLLPGIILLIVNLAKKIGYKLFDSWCLAVVFVLGSAFLRLISEPQSYYYAQVLTVFLVFASLYEFFHKKRYLLIGILMACALATRVTAGFGVLFFILEIITNRGLVRKKVTELCEILFPISVTVFLLGIYNYFRFGGFFEQGYSMQILYSDSLAKARDLGLFGFVHLPGNLFYAFLQGPVPVFRDGLHVLQFPFITADAWGMGIFFTSAYLLKLFFLPYSKQIQMNLLITSIFIAVPLFLYYGIGWVQIGYRYSFDFMPFIFLIFMIGYRDLHRKLSKRMVLLFLCSIAFNYYLVAYFH